MRLELRKATLDDAAAVLEVRETSIRALAPAHYSFAEVELWLMERNAAGTLQRLARGLLWLGLRADRVVGFACGVPGEVESLFVRPAYQGFGFGKRLLAAAERASLAAGVAAIKVISTRNAAAFYRAQGYRHVAEVLHRLPSGAAVAARELRKDLIPRPAAGE
jgi:GNAT superfamily N-acetyltransferase